MMRFEDGVAFFLPGPDLAGLRDGGRLNRAVHLAGGRLVSGPMVPAESYTVELWFWNGLPNDARPVTGYLFARSAREAGRDARPGRIVRSRGTTVPVPGRSGPALSGKTEISPRTWHHLVLTRTGGRLAVHLDGSPEPELTAEFAPDAGAGPCALIIGGRDDHEATFEGKIDEVALYDRPLTVMEIAEHARAARAESFPYGL